MKSKYVCLVAAILSLLLFTFSAFGQQETKKRWHAATLDGTSGLFKTWDAEALRRGEVNLSIGFDMFNRDPGELTIGRLPVSVGVGIVDRFEVFGGATIQRYIKANSIGYYRRLPGQTPAPATTPTGIPFFSQVAPFIDVPDAMGFSDLHLGIKLNLMSERKEDQASIALAGFAVFPGQLNTTGLNRGLSSGAYQGGLNILISKTARDFIRIHGNIGTSVYTDPYVDSKWLTELQNEFIFRGGVEFPASKPYSFIAELGFTKYYGERAIGLNPKDPFDLILGMRVYPKEWISFGAGYQLSFNHIESKPQMSALSYIDAKTAALIKGAGHHGFVVQGTLGMRRNDPPTVSCAVAKQTILQGETTTIRANAVDPDGDALTFSWSTTGGKISGTDSTATFDATGVAPGKYTVTASVRDKKHEATCSAEIAVLKRNYPPTVKLEPPSADVMQGEVVNFQCQATDANNDPLTYTWTVDGQSLAAAGSQITFGTEGRTPGTYNVKCTVSDGEATGDATSVVTVRERITPNQPPSIECLTTTLDVASGGSVELRVRATDPDKDKLTYSWSATGGAISGTGDTVTYNAAGVRAGNYTVTATVDDGRGGKASCSMMIYVSERLSVTKDKCGYFATGGARVDNCAKAILDDLAVRMKNEPNLRANVIGYTDASAAERSIKGLGERRAKAVAAYLTKKGVDSARMKITDGGTNNPVGDNKTSTGRRLNRRVEIELTAR